jgi:hypothetical protein
MEWWNDKNENTLKTTDKQAWPLLSDQHSAHLCIDSGLYYLLLWTYPLSPFHEHGVNLVLFHLSVIAVVSTFPGCERYFQVREHQSLLLWISTVFHSMSKENILLPFVYFINQNFLVVVCYVISKITYKKWNCIFADENHNRTINVKVNERLGATSW